MAMDEGMGIGDVLALTKDNDGFLGGSTGGILALIIVFILLFGGNGVWGGNGNNQYATSTQVQNGFDNQNIMTRFDSISNGISSLAYDQLGVMNGINANISNVGYEISNGFCGINRNIDAVKFDAQLNTRSIEDAIHSEGEATRALITENTIQQLREDLQSAQLTLANAAQTQNVLNALGRYVSNPPCYSNYTCGCNSGVTVA